jgi:hypothetical protein
MESITTIPTRRNDTIDLTSKNRSLFNYSDLSVGVVHYNDMETFGENWKKVPVWGEHVGLHSIKALDELGIRLFLCSTAFPKREKTLERMSIDVEHSIKGFVKTIGRNEILPFLGIYQRLVYSYFFFKN